MVAGYYKGIVDDVVMRAVDVFMSVPLLFLALMVIFVLGPSFKNIIIVFAVARWMLYCRITRGVVMSLREHSFICLLYTAPSPRDRTRSRMPSSA